MSQTTPLPSTPGRFSRIQAIPLGDAKLLFISGLAASGDTPPDTGKQTEIVFERIRMLLAEHGAEMKHLVKITVFLADMRDYAKYNAVRNQVFADVPVPPTSSAVEARLVAPEYLVEIEGIAYVPGAAV